MAVWVCVHVSSRPIRIHRDKEGSTHTGGKWQESKYLQETLQRQLGLVGGI